MHANYNYDYIIKCDDDVFVHADALFNEIHTKKNSTFFGSLMLNQVVERSGRYALTKDKYNSSSFDPYCSGGGFVMSRDIVHKIIPLFNWDKPFTIDDAYIGHLVYKTGAKGHKGFHMWNNKCEYPKLHLVTHQVETLECMIFFA